MQARGRFWLATGHFGNIEQDWRALRRRWVKRAAVSLGALLAIIATAGALFFWRLSQGPLSLDFMRDRIEARINQNLGGMKVRLAGVIIERDTQTGMPHFRLRDVELLDPTAQTIARAPKAAVGVDGAALLSGRVIPKQIELIGPRILIRRNLDGGFDLGFGPAAASENEAADADGKPAIAGAKGDQEPGFGQIAPETRGGTLIDFLSGTIPDSDQANEAIADLNTVLVSNAAIQLYDEANNATWYAPAANLAFKRMPYGFALFADASIASGGVPWRTEISASYRKETRSFSVSARIFDLVPADVSDEIFALSKLAQVRLPLTGHAEIEFSDKAEIARASAELSAAAGQVGFPGYISEPIKVDEGLLRLDYDPPTGSMVISDSTIAIGGVNTAITGRIEPVRQADRRLSGLRIVINARSHHSGSVAGLQDSLIDRVDFTGLAAVDEARLDVEDAVIMAGESGVRMRGSFAGGDQSVGINLALRFRDLSAAMLKKLWPPIVAPNTRTWIEKNISAGKISDGELIVDLPPNAFAEAQSRQSLSKEMISGRFSLTGVTAAYMSKLPVIANASGEARIQGDVFDLAMEEGEVTVPSGSKIALKNGTMHATALLAPVTPAEFHLAATSDVSSLLEFMRLDPINLAPDAGFDASRLKGNTTVALALDLPLEHEITRDDVKLKADARIENASLKDALDGIDLSDGDLTLTVDNSGVAAQGPIKINGIAAKLNWSRQSGPDGAQSAVIETELDESERDKIGAHVNDYIGGPVKLKATMAQFHDDPGKVRIEADLSKAELRLDTVGWVRGPSAKTTASFDYTKNSEGGSINNLTIKGSGVLIKGNIKLAPKGGVDEANFSNIALSDENQFGLHLKRSEGLTSVSISGLSFDARPLIKSMFSARSSQPAGDKNDSPGQAYDVQASLDRIYAHRGEVITGITGSLFVSGGAVQRAEVSGTFASGQPVVLRIRGSPDGTRELRIGGRDAGAALRAANLYSKVAGGAIDFSAKLGGGSDTSVRDGRLILRDFEVRNEAALAELDQKGKPKKTSSRDQGVVFKQLYLPFTADARFVRIGDTTIKGPQLCATAEGLVRKTDGAIDIDGTIVPACGINLLPGQIPLLGWLITGGPNEGLFGLTYALGGTISNPGFQVNPVSAVAPGLFRKLFEYGSSSGTNNQKREKSN
jgi:hypothetical protein